MIIEGHTGVCVVSWSIWTNALQRLEELQFYLVIVDSNHEPSIMECLLPSQHQFLQNIRDHSDIKNDIKEIGINIRRVE